jgi:integrase
MEDFPGATPTIKQKLAAVRMLYDFLVVRQITPSNSTHSVRGPRYVVKKGKTPFWSREDAKTLLDSIPKDSVSGLRDLALIAAMFYSFARVSAVLKLKVDDYYHNGARRPETPRKRRQGARYARASPARADIGRIHCGRRPSERATAAGFLTPSDVTPGGQPASRFTWKTTAGLSMPNRWPDMNLHALQSFTTEHKDEITLSEVERIRL